MDPASIAIRLGHYAALSLIAGGPLFLWLSLGQRAATQTLARYRPHQTALCICGLVLSALGLLSATATMAGTSLLPVDWTMVSLVISATSIGKAALARIALLAILLFALVAGRGRTAAFQASLGIAAAATLAWSGHAASGDDLVGWLHRLADILHIVMAVLWIGGMTCLLASLDRPQPDDQLTASSQLRAFAWIGPIVVLLLVLTGLLNMIVIMGPAGFAGLFATGYGRLLTFKILIFLLMLAFAANNRFRLTPHHDRSASSSVGSLRRSVGMELTLAFAILALVAVLGTLDPQGAG